MLDQVRWVQNGYKIRVSSDNIAALYESSTLGGTCQSANQLLLIAEPLAVC
jgi:hypothetical protein